MASYTRQSTISDGDTITAALFNNEYNQLLSAFVYASSGTTGHQHDGTTAEGGNVHTIGDQDFLNKIVADSTNNRWGVYVQVSGAAVEQIRIQDGAIVPVTDNDIDLGTSSLEFKDGYFDGTVYADAINFNGTAITSTAAELNILDGVTSTAAELNILDGVTSTAAELNILDGVTSTAAELNILDGVTASAIDINLIDGITNGTVIASKVIITDANKDISGGRNITISGELDAATLDISGNADIDGVLETDGLSINGTVVSSTAAELNILDGVTSTAAELNILDGVTSTAAELNILDGVTSTAAELNLLDTASANSVVNSKAVIYGSSGEVAGTLSTAAQANITSLGTLTALQVDNININGNAITSTAGTDLTITPLSGQQIVLDGTIVIDAGVVTGATSITSTAFVGDITGNVTGNTSGTAATVTTAAQTNITSLGTLTALTVDNLGVNGNTITANSGALNLTPATGSAIVLDGTINVDAGVVTGATSITSTAFVGAVTGNADTATALATARTIGGTSFDGTANIAVALATLATTATVTDSTANTNFPVVFNNESNALLDDTGALRYNPSTGTLLVPNLVVAGTTSTVDTVTMEASNAIIFEGATADDHETTLTIVDPTADRTINLPNQSGTIPVLAAASNTAVTSTPEELNILDGVTSTAAELNILDGVTSTAAELNALDGITAVVGELNALDIGSTAVGTAVASKAVILDSNKDYTGIRNLTISGELDAATLDISGNVDIDGVLETDNLTINGAQGSDGQVLTSTGSGVGWEDAGGGASSLADTLAAGATSGGANITLSTTDKVLFRDAALYINSSADGQLDIVADTEIQIVSTTVDLNGNLDVSGSITIAGTAVTSTAAELNILDGVTSTAAELNILDGVTSTAAELNILDGVTSTATELNLLDGSSAGSIVNSKAVIYSSAGIVNATDMAVSGSGNRSISITSSDGIASMEIGAAAGNAAFIDLKTPSTDDFDVRLSSSGDGAGGSLAIAGGTFTLSGSGETMATFADDGAVTLYHNNAAKLATASGGITVTGVVAATTLTGALTGNVTGNASGSSGSCTGLAATATALATARTIAGVSFNGTANIALNNNAITNGAGYVTSSGVTSVATGNGLSGGTITGTGTLTMSGSYSGNFSATGNITAYSSDSRLKDFKGKIDNPLDKIGKLNGYYYEWNDTAKSIDPNVFKEGLEVGVNAQEVEAVLPEVITQAPIVEIHKLDTDYKTVYYDKIVPLLIEGIKELKKEIEELKTKGSA